MKFRNDFVTNASRLHRVGVFNPNTYTIHETGNTKATAKNERDNLQNNPGSTSFHSVVDAVECVRCIRFDTGAYHAGDGYYGNGNAHSLSLEICTSGLLNNFAETWKNAVHVVAVDLLSLDWGVGNLRQHYNWSGKNCPQIIRERGLWEQFKTDVKTEMERIKMAKKSEKCSFPDAEKWVKEKGISDGSNPKGTATREQVWQMLFMASKKGVF